MSRDYINIGSTPPEEKCIGVGQPGARQETLIYARQLKREFPAGTFTMKAFEHDFGTYHEAVAWYGGNDNEAEREAAFDAEGDCAPNWDLRSRCELWMAFGQAYFIKHDVKVPTEKELREYQTTVDQEFAALSK